MHIPDGWLGPGTCAALGGVMLPVWAGASAAVRRRLSARQTPYIALAAAFCFVVMMFNFPIPGGTSGHVTGAVLAALVVGPWAACLALTVAVVLQALLAGDGGVLALPANCFTMAAVAPFTGWLLYRLLAGAAPAAAPRRAAAAAAAGFVGLTLSALAAAVLLGIQPALAHAADGAPLYCPYPLSVTLPAMLVGHVYFGVAEAGLTGLVVAWLGRHAPEALATPAGGAGLLVRPAAPWLALAALALATPLGLFAPEWAGAAGPFGEWSSRDLTNPHVAGDHALPRAPEGLRRTEGAWSGPLPDYALPDAEGDQAGAFRRGAGYVLSALAGIGAAAALIYLLGRRWLAAPGRGPTDAR